MDRVFIVNEAGAVTLRTDHPSIAERVEFLPVWYRHGGVPSVSDDTRAELRGELLERLGMDATSAADRCFVLLAVRLTEIKKPLLAIETIAELVRRGRTDVDLVIAGSGELPTRSAPECMN